MIKITVRVRGGVVQDIDCAGANKDVLVEVLDYDVDGVGSTEFDEDGEPCLKSEYSFPDESEVSES